MKISPPCCRGSRGTSTLEFIVVLPTLLFVFLAAVELSRGWMVANLVTQAAREGARVGTVTNPFDPAPAIARIGAVLAGVNLISTAASVTCSAPCQPGSQVTAAVTVNFQTIFPVMLPMLSGPMPVTSTAIMRFE